MRPLYIISKCFNEHTKKTCVLKPCISIRVEPKR